MALSSLQLEAFVAVASSGTFSGAARTLHISQSALSQRVLNLEEQLGTTLFVRAPGGVQLTVAGIELLKYCRIKDTLETELTARIQGGDAQALSGTVRIAGISSAMRSLVLPALAPVLGEHPGLRLEAQVRELRELPKLLRTGECDFAVTWPFPMHADFTTYDVGEENYVMIEPISGTAPAVYIDHDAEDETTEQFLRLQGEVPRSLERHFVDEIYAVIDAVAHGLGRAVVPMHLLQNQSRVRSVPYPQGMQVKLLLVHRTPSVLTALQKTVVHALGEGIPKYLHTP